MRIRHSLANRSFLRGLRDPLARAFAAALALSALTGCLGSGGTAGVVQTSNSSSAVLDPAATPESDPTLVINSVLRSKANSGELIDVIGNNTGTIGAACGRDGTASSDCTCSFTYTRSTGATEAFETSSVYSESDLIRCNYTLIPSDATSVTARLHIKPSGGVERWSNSVAFDATASNGLDPASIASFLAPKRHLCREIVKVDYSMGPQGLGDNGMYDPVLSEDPSIAVTFNFYATNLGDAMAQHAFYNRSWECTGNPSSSPWGTYSVYSMAGDKIHDPSSPGDNARNRFLLAKKATGTFLYPLKAWVAPNIYGTIGYAAKSIPTGSETEACPTSAPIPAGMRWVKIWPFRGDVVGRDIPANPVAVSMQVACTPGNLDGKTLTQLLGIASCVPGSEFLVKVGNGSTECSSLPSLGALPNSAIHNQDGTRYDFIFVATPPEVMSRDFRQGSASVNKYIPRRSLRVDGACTPGAANCKTLTYSVKLGDVTNYGNSDTSSAIYPLCALQEATLQ